MRSMLTKTSALVLIFAFSAAVPTAASDVQQYLSTPIWYLQFEVGFKANYKDSIQQQPTTFVTSISMDRTFSAMWPVDLRMDGPSPVLNSAMLSGTADGTTSSVAVQQQMYADLMSRMNSAANWMSTGGALNTADDASFEEMQAAADAGRNAAMGPCRLEYLRVDEDRHRINEMGSPYNQTTRTKRSGSGQVLAGGGQGVTFEIDGPSKKYTLILPYSFSDMGEMMSVNSVTEVWWGNSAPSVTRDSSETGLSAFPAHLVIDDPKDLLAGMVVVRGDIDLSSDKITGERSVGASYEDGQIHVTGTLKLRYTLSMTPPAKAVNKSK